MLEKEFAATTLSAGSLEYRLNSLATQVTEFSTEVVELKKPHKITRLHKRLYLEQLMQKKSAIPTYRSSLENLLLRG
ncbi:hypothetical protein [Liquorilactobacillus satsumensis]|uniref:hypothetical protein n=1 Tax=Liquorilactobacillus satsumensis TaxID=259059 RepID=UPI0039EA699D